MLTPQQTQALIRAVKAGIHELRDEVRPEYIAERVALQDILRDIPEPPADLHCPCTGCRNLVSTLAQTASGIQWRCHIHANYLPECPNCGCRHK